MKVIQVMKLIEKRDNWSYCADIYYPCDDLSGFIFLDLAINCSIIAIPIYFISDIYTLISSTLWKTERSIDGQVHSIEIRVK